MANHSLTSGIVPDHTISRSASSHTMRIRLPSTCRLLLFHDLLQLRQILLHQLDIGRTPVLLESALISGSRDGNSSLRHDPGHAELAGSTSLLARELLELLDELEIVIEMGGESFCLASPVSRESRGISIPSGQDTSPERRERNDCNS